MAENGQPERAHRASFAVMHLDHEVCARALETRDPRFDGVFFVGVRSTGIYCRPICPARSTLRVNRRYFTHAAAAERAGFRPCLRCRPELAPGLARVDAVPRLAQSAARRIAAGVLNETDVDGLARMLGASARQLRRAMREEIGVSPIELAQTHRLLLAKQLLTESTLPIARIAFASGFRSVRRFNALFLERYRLNPHTLRKHDADAGASSGTLEGSVTLTLAYRPPLLWEPLLSFLAARAAPSVENVADGVYSRTLRIGAHTGWLCVSRPHGDARASLRLEVSASLVPVLVSVVARVRRLFDLDAEPEKIAAHLTAAGLVVRGADRGLRVPGAADPFELAVRAILGQQVTVKGASTLMSRLTESVGSRIDTGVPELTHLAATPEQVAGTTPAQIASLGMPLARATTIHTLATAVARGDLQIGPEADVRVLTRQLLALPGIGPWTAEYVIMRAVHWPDAFPESDLVLRRAAGDLSPAKLRQAAEGWRPWRAYAAMHLWRR